MNPSTYELLAGIHAAAGRGGARAAEQPERDPGRRARGASCPRSPPRVVPTTAPQEGLAALLAFDPAARRARTPTPSVGAADALRIGGVAPAARDDAQGRFIAGEAVGYAGGELVAWGDPAATLAATLDAAGRTAPSSSPASPARRPRSASEDVEAHVPDGVEVEYHEGGQPAWWWLLCAE